MLKKLSLVMKKVTSLIKSRPFPFATIAILIVLLISCGQVFNMYFWQDDSALIFKLQHQVGAAGSYGVGIIGDGAYKFLVTLFVPFFPIFGMNPFGYFAVGVLAYALATATFYLFSSEVFQNKKAGFFATLIFAAGYISSDTMFRFSNSWQTNFGIILGLLSFWAFLKFLRKPRDFKYYLFGLGFFILAVEFVYIRSHSLILPILALDILITMIPFKVSKLPILLARQIPFWIVFYNWYLRGGTMGSSGLSGIIKQLISGKVEVLATLFATVGNALVPNVLQDKFISVFDTRTEVSLLFIAVIVLWGSLKLFGANKLTKIAGSTLLILAFFFNHYLSSKGLFWYRSQEDVLSGVLGLYLIISFFLIGLTLWKRYRDIAFAILFGLVVLVSQIFGYFIQYPDSIFGTTHRYLSHSFIGYCLIFGALGFYAFEILKHQKLQVRRITAVLPLLLILVINLSLGVKYQHEILQNRSQPTRVFYQTLKQLVPEIKKGALFYFDTAGGVYQQQFNDFFSVGSMPNQTALAIYYGVDRYDLSMVTSIDELLSKISNKEADIDNTYSFYYGPKGLINTTAILRDSLKNGTEDNILSSTQNSPTSVSLNGPLETPESPFLLKINASILSDSNNQSFLQKSDKFGLELEDQFISYLLSRQSYYSEASASSLSQWKFQEIPNIIDNNVSTSWRGHRIYWHDHHHEQMTIDLKNPESVGSVVWTNWNHTLSPTSYTIEASLDGSNFTKLKTVTGGPERKDGEVIVEKFQDTNARYIRMDITGTLSNDAPAISEFEVVDALFKNIDFDQANEYIASPFNYISKLDEENLVFSKAAPLIYLNAEVETDKGTQTAKLPIRQFGDNLNYQFVFNGGGTKIKNIDVTVPDMPVKLNVYSSSISNLSLENFKERGLITHFSTN